jgi:hypothetical protein
MGWRYNADELSVPSISGGIDFLTGKNGVRPLPALYHTGNSPAQIAADGVDSTPVITEIYVATVLVPFTCLATGIAVFNGSVVATDKYKVALFDVNGTMIRTSAAAGFQPTVTDAYEQVPFALGPDGITAATTVVLPSGTYYIGCIYNGTTNRFNAHGVGMHPTRRVTGAAFATAFNTTSLTITPPTTFTATDKPPIASLY